MIVVSEIGEQWSPQTAPAMQAEIAIIINSLFTSLWNALTTIGIKSPKVPHDVPVANAKNAPIKNTNAGRKPIIIPFSAKFSTNPATYSAAPRESVMPFKVHASVNIKIAGTMLLNPSGTAFMHSSKFSTLVAR